jgi:hypothetical protein
MAKNAVEIDLLYFEGCPSYRQAWSDILDVLVELKIGAIVRPVLVDNADLARELNFAGSPSIKVNGADLEGYDGPGTMACRVYGENGGRGSPSKSLMAERLRAAADLP